MKYLLMELNDKTIITHSDIYEDGSVKVYFERPTRNNPDDCFDHALCTLPEYKWEDVSGYSEDEMKYFQEFTESVAHLIFRFARNGGFENASGF